MEVVLLWLDELEDWILIAPLLWWRLRPCCLAVGLLCALLIPLTGVSPRVAATAVALSVVAAASVALWLLELCLFALFRRRKTPCGEPAMATNA